MNQVNQILKNTSTSTRVNTSTSSVKNRNEVARTVSYLNELLQPPDDSINLFNKFAWLYNESSLIRLAVEAKETDKRGSPTKLFVWLVKRDLGYDTK